ncbi:MAG: hypothetical protein K8F91_27520, partial [Candidatus Obscuribacterales bacterium]|nr:hypothetical protein [Candidatus Obscuribacterales bacterium]
QNLKKQIEKLRASVPPAAELDILILDLEAMSEHTGCDLLGIEEPAGLKDEKKDGLMDSLVREVGGKVPGKQAGNPTGNPIKPGGAAAKEVSSDPLGLKHLTRRVYIAGKYQNLISMLKDIEHYQRVVGISELVIATSSDDPELTKTLSAQRGKQLELNLPVMSFLMHVYYLPEDTDTTEPIDKQAIK